ncbi:UxaA family hydrolase [Lacrimispora celerecrescens]|uniref:Altronate hydrolase n=1 Tax=[Clostridium] celerecrescens 18A TaxID=1286362 RepID=A0A2M8Z702_9FIRM|nr:altronate dehydratase family protein [Lacrimispora celerecrescens]PJJ29220.1 altronate hydrolase [[Clostridium] celerecrescens 18A]
MQDFIKIHSGDNVAVALKPLSSGTAAEIGGNTVTLLEDIPQGHKFALADIPAGSSVIKYGCAIGMAKEHIKTGAWIHTHNLKTGLGDLLTYTYEKQETAVVPTEERFFQGYRRPDGKVGVRNEIWIIPTVGCVNNIATALERMAKKYVGGSIDEIAAFPHPYGCSQMGDDQEYTRTILADLINHPNAGGVLVLGLGCENSSVAELKSYIGDYDENRVKFLVTQESEDEMADAMDLIGQLAEYAGTFHREPVSCSELIIGMKCGGSDGLSGITANPTVGAFSDMLVSKGGTTILTEVPEMFGAETLLMNRCQNEETFDKTVDLINDFKNYFTSHNQTIYENPSPGNKKGGISTLEDKSLGCVQKSGSAPVVDVLKYGEPVRDKGLNLLSAPGNDLVASTALAASGAHIVLFTTGRGTPFACPVPTMKISTNTALSTKKSNWIDFNCGVLVEGSDMDTLKNEFFDFVMEVASGKKVKSEEAGFHDMAIFKQGVTL